MRTVELVTGGWRERGRGRPGGDIAPSSLLTSDRPIPLHTDKVAVDKNPQISSFTDLPFSVVWTRGETDLACAN